MAKKTAAKAAAANAAAANAASANTASGSVNGKAGEGVHRGITGPSMVEPIDPVLTGQILTDVKLLREEWEGATENNLTLLQRRRKTGPGVSNYGFIDKVSDLAEANPHYAHYIYLPDLKNCIRNIEVCRDIIVLLQGFIRAVTNTMMVYSSEGFTIAREYYNQVKLRANEGDPNAIELYRAMKSRFRKSRRAFAEPTEKEIERDVRAILTHKKDGEILVKGSAPKVSGGKVEVVDDARKSKAMFKDSVEGTVKD